MRAVIVFAGLTLAAAAIVPRYAEQLNGKAAPAAMAVRPEKPPVAVGATAAASSGSVVVPRDSRGHFQIDGRVDGRHIRFVVDTGASVVALTASDAATLGLHPARRDFAIPMSTANGVVRAAPVQLDMVEIGDVAVRDVAAMVLPEEALSESLLGMSFLSRLRRFEYGEGRLVLEQ